MNSMGEEIEKIKNGVKDLLDRLIRSAESAKKIAAVCNLINNSWSGSDLAGHCHFFYGNFDTPPYNKRFSIEWGLIHGIPEGWYEKSDEEVLQKIKNDSGILPEDLDKEADLIVDHFEKLRKQTIILFSSISKDAAVEIEKFNLQTKLDIFNQYWKRQIMTRDSDAMSAGIIIPTHKYYDATALFMAGATEQLNDFLFLIDKIFAQSKSAEQEFKGQPDGRVAYIDKYTLLRLSRIDSKEFDLTRLIALCNELDDNYSLENYHSCAMLQRAILDHIPPVFQKTSFAEVCAQYGTKSFKDIARPLNETAKKIGDDYLHTQISKKVLAVTKTQISFQANLDTLLNEIAAILEKR